MIEGEGVKVVLANDDKLKCPACGNKTFMIKQKEKEVDGVFRTKWMAICDDCGLMLKFKKPIHPKD